MMHLHPQSLCPSCEHPRHVRGACAGTLEAVTIDALVWALRTIPCACTCAAKEAA